MFDLRRHMESLMIWLRRPHVVRWWGDPEQELTSSLQRPARSQAVIVADDRPVGYLCWQRPSRDELEAVGLADLPEGLVDIDILIGEKEFVGRGIGTNQCKSGCPRANTLRHAEHSPQGSPGPLSHNSPCASHKAMRCLPTPVGQQEEPPVGTGWRRERLPAGVTRHRDRRLVANSLTPNVRLPGFFG